MYVVKRLVSSNLESPNAAIQKKRRIGRGQFMFISKFSNIRKT